MSQARQPEVITLWPNGAPGSEGWSQRETVMDGSAHWDSAVVIRNVSQPTLTAYLPDPSLATGTGIVVCPGGAFMFLCMDKEGTDIAQWLNAQGIAAFVLKYRLVETSADDAEFVRQAEDFLAGVGTRTASWDKVVPLAVADGRQAIRVVRERAAEWGLARDRIGIMGFSAGGVVAAGVAVQHDADSRPDFVAPIYGASGEGVTPPENAAPMFIAVANDDRFAASACVPLYLAWNAAGHPVEMHIYARGGHGFALLKNGLPVEGWIERFKEWLHAEGMLEARN